MAYAAYLGPFDFLFQSLIGIGMVTWLLEDERQRVLAAADRIEHLAYHDPLTDLPNRSLMVQHLRNGARPAPRRGGSGSPSSSSTSTASRWSTSRWATATATSC